MSTKHEPGRRIAAALAVALLACLLLSCAPGSLPLAQKGTPSTWSYQTLSSPAGGRGIAAARSLPPASSSWPVLAGLKATGKSPLMSKLPAVTVADATSAASSVATPPVPHPLADHKDCLACHAVGTGSKPAPENHKERGIDVCLYCHSPQEGASAIPPLPAKPSAAFCLGCHGPFEDVAKKSADFVTEDGEKVNPHVFVPHNSTKIVNCIECHEPHELPATAATVLSKPELQYCFSCHHQQDFRPCSECHKEG
ncbi:MAG TPA: cytochrome c3 family protein [Rectinemataceae bacterium]|nr:cytochrome c3 family protein [Rectinemataceae bacterium]